MNCCRYSLWLAVEMQCRSRLRTEEYLDMRLFYCGNLTAGVRLRREMSFFFVNCAGKMRGPEERQRSFLSVRTDVGCRMLEVIPHVCPGALRSLQTNQKHLISGSFVPRALTPQCLAHVSLFWPQCRRRRVMDQVCSCFPGLAAAAVPLLPWDGKGSLQRVQEGTSPWWDP